MLQTLFQIEKLYLNPLPKKNSKPLEINSRKRII